MEEKRNIIELTDKNYNQIIKKGQCYLIDFYGKLCGPCGELTPILEKLEPHARKHNVVIAKCDIARNPKITEYYGVESVPFTIFVNKEAKLVFPEIGLMDQSVYAKGIEKVCDSHLSFFQRLFKKLKS